MPVSARRSPASTPSRARDSGVDGAPPTSPRSVNLIALPTRLSRTCRRRAGVAHDAVRDRRATRRRPARAPWRGRAGQRSSARSSDGVPQVRTAIGSRSSLPASIFEKSRMSLMMASSASPRAADRRRRTPAARRSSGVSSSSAVMPITPFIGVRISWLMVARNSDLSRDVSSALSRARMRASSASLRSLMSRANHGGVRQAAGGPARAGHLDRHHVAVRPARAQLQGASAIRSTAGPRDVRQRGGKRVPGGRLDEPGEGAVEGVRLRKPEDALGRGVPGAYGPVGVDGDDGVGGRSRHRPELLLAPRERAQWDQAEGHEHEQGDHRARRRDERGAREQRHAASARPRSCRPARPSRTPPPSRPRPANEGSAPARAGARRARRGCGTHPPRPLLAARCKISSSRWTWNCHVSGCPPRNSEVRLAAASARACIAPAAYWCSTREVADRWHHGEQHGHDRGQRRREARDERAGSLHRAPRSAAIRPGETCRPRPVSSSRPAGEARKLRYCRTATADWARVTR